MDVQECFADAFVLNLEIFTEGLGSVSATATVIDDTTSKGTTANTGPKGSLLTSVDPPQGTGDGVPSWSLWSYES